MKKHYMIILWILLPVFVNSVEAQTSQQAQEKVPVKMPAGEKDKQASVSYRFIDNHRVVIDLQDNQYDRLFLQDMRGSVVLKQGISVGFSGIDLSNLEEGVYLVVLRSTLTLKEKSCKIVVRK
jgi:hypothetical protein